MAENVELTDPILQRFDILCVLQDTVDPIKDEQLAYFVVTSHMRSHPDWASSGMTEEDDDEDADPMQDGLDRELGAMDEDDDENEIRRSMNRPGTGRRGLGARPTSLSALSSDNTGIQPLDQTLLKKYITYARAFVKVNNLQTPPFPFPSDSPLPSFISSMTYSYNTITTHPFVKPVLHAVDSEKISSLYADLRRQSSISGGVPIAVRHIESVMRMAEASAKMHLRDHVREDDVDLAIKVMLESFMQAQKVSIRKVLQRSFRKYVTYGEESNQLLMHQLQTLITEAEKYKRLKGVSSDSTEVFINELENRAKELNIFDLKVTHLIKTLIK